MSTVATPTPRPSYRHVGKGSHGLGNVYHGVLRDGSGITWECSHRHGTRGEAEACAEAQLGLPVVVPVYVRQAGLDPFGADW